MYESEKAERYRILEINSLHGTSMRRGVKEDTVKSQMVRNLKLTPEFDVKVT